jgi:16S rRNA (cytidine1402-2'-O)-methyltransferase
MSPRAVEVLGRADLIAAEDTRHSQRLLRAYAIESPVIAYHEHSDERRLARIDDCLATGGIVALISDAGTPLISDPGYRLVRHVLARGFPVHPVPGACAAIAALSVAGLATDRFLFEGFLPAKESAREKRLTALAPESPTLVFYEAPHRIESTLRAMVDVFGGAREAVIAREITKLYETVKRGTLAELRHFVAADPNQQRGEIVLLVAGAAAAARDIDADVLGLLERLAQEMPAKRAAAIVADHTGLRKKQLYDHLLATRNGQGD